MQVTAHYPNPGSMLGLSQPGTKIWVEPNDDPRKKLKYGWQLVDHENGHLTSINTGAVNKIVKEALITRQLKCLYTYNNCLPEVKYGENSRIDFLLTGSSDSAPGTYLEVKSVTLMRQSGLAEFPDSVTDRGLKHLGDLLKIAKLSKRAVLLFLVQRSDCAAFDVASDIDPACGKAYRGFKPQDIEVMIYSCDLSPDTIRIDKKLLI